MANPWGHQTNFAGFLLVSRIVRLVSGRREIREIPLNHPPEWQQNGSRSGGSKMIRSALYVRVSTKEQRTIRLGGASDAAVPAQRGAIGADLAGTNVTARWVWHSIPPTREEAANVRCAVGSWAAAVRVWQITSQ